MSMPSNLSEEEKQLWADAMIVPIAAGTIYHRDGQKFKILEDCTAHSCPFVIEIDENGKEIGKEFAMTIYMHSQFVEELENEIKAELLWSNS